MMPLAPPSTDLPRAHRPQIGFSIDSLVAGGNDGKVRSLRTTTRSTPIVTGQKRSQRSLSSGNTAFSEQNITSPSPEPGVTNISDYSCPTGKEIREFFSPFTYLLQAHHHFRSNNSSQRPIPTSPRQLEHPSFHLPLPRGSHNSSADSTLGNTFSSNLATATGNHNSIINTSISSSKDISPGYHRPSTGERNTDLVTSASSSSSPSPTLDIITRSFSNPDQRNSSPKDSDFPRSLQHNCPNVVAQTLPCALKPHSPPQLPPVGPHGFLQFPSYSPAMLNFASASAVAHLQHQPGQPGLPGWIPQSRHHSTTTAHPLYPWLLTKQSRLFPHHFGSGLDLSGLLLNPFRKPKRIRTAFSPTQLLKLEHVFERNHYVVGTERKKLAASLSLSETQIKIWLQNRRTKHKRMQAETVTNGGGGASDSANGNGSSSSRSNFSLSAISADSSTRNFSSEEIMMMSEEEGDDEEELIMDDDFNDYSDQEEEGEKGNLKTSSSSETTTRKIVLRHKVNKLN